MKTELYLSYPANNNGLRFSFPASFLVYSALLFLLLTIPTVVLAKSPRKEGAKQVRINIQKLENSIDNHQEAFQQQENDEILLLQELEFIQEKIWQTEDKLNNLLKQVAEQKRLIQLKNIDLQKVKAAKEKTRNHLVNRMNAYYTTGHIGFLNVAFSTKTLPELLSFKDNFDVLIAYDKKQIQLYRKRIQELESSRQALALEQDVLEDFVAEVNAEKTIFNQTREEKEQLIKRIRTQKKLHNQAIKEMQIAARQLTRKLVQIKKEQLIQNNTFLQNKGKLRPPVPGELITRFLEEKENALGILRKSLGIALKAANDSKIVATEKGVVTYAGYMSGYGNTVIIDHGLHYYTVTSRIERITIKKGQKVRAGTKIGITGDTATLIEDGLYFEVRHGKKPQDPLLWLDPNRIKPEAF